MQMKITDKINKLLKSIIGSKYGKPEFIQYQEPQVKLYIPA